MENKADKTSESRLQTEPKDKKKEKKFSTKSKRKWWRRLFCHVSRVFHAFIMLTVCSLLLLF
jgi:hypothetical protein